MRRIAVTLSIALMFSVIAGDLQANEKKPTKENPASSKSDAGNGNPVGNSPKFQEAVPTAPSSAQPVEIINSSSLGSSTNAASGQGNNSNKNSSSEELGNSKNKNQGQANTDSTAGSPNSSKPESSQGKDSQTNSTPSTSSATDPSQGSSKNPKMSIGSVSALGNSSVTAAKDKKAVVSARAFANSKLLVRKSGFDKVNASAKLLEMKSRDAKCGVPEKDSKGNGNSNANASNANKDSASPNKGGKAAANSNSKVKAGSKNAAGDSGRDETEQCKDYILVFNDNASDSEIEGAVKEAKGKVLRSFNNVFRGALLNAPPSKIAALAKNPKVQSIELDGAVTKQDIFANPVWGLDRIDQRTIPLDSSYDDLGNSGYTIPVYVVDTGIYAEHTEFTGRVAPGATTITDGYGTWDCNGHGTHVSGSIAGSNFGVAKTATLIPIRVLDCSGSGSYSGVIAGLDWIAANHGAGVPAVVNMSLGGPASSSLDTAVNNLISRGITVVVAAGNSGADACNYSPARVPGAITVAAAADDDVRANFSNFGSCVDVFAPGVGITSAWINGVTGVAVASGTSMATPHVAGAIARFLYTNPTASPSQVANSLTLSATPDVIANIGPGTPNRNLYIDIALDPTNQTPTATKPGKSRKTTNPGKGSKS